WVADDETERKRRVIAERAQLVSQLTRIKNRVQSVLHANLLPRLRGNLFSKRGRAWLNTAALPTDQKRLVARHLADHSRLAVDLGDVDRSVAQDALHDARVRRLMTIGGVNVIVAASVLAAIGDITRFSSPEKLVSYFGLHPRVRQSADHAAFHGHITKHGRGHARGMLVEAAWSIASTPGPLRAFFHRRWPRSRQRGN